MSSCKCGQPHVTARGGQACTSHISTGPKGQPAKERAGQPCTNSPMSGQGVCHAHGGRSTQAKAAGRRRESEQKARAEIERMLGDAGEAVTDPIGKLCAIAGRAVAFMEALGDKASDLDVIDDSDRATIALYGRSIKDAGQVVESIIRMGIAERLAKAEQEQTAAIVAFIDGVLSDLGHNPRAPEVAGIVAKRLELVS